MLTVREVAKLKQVNPEAVYRAIRRGALASHTILDRLAVHKDAAAAWEPIQDRKERGKRGGRPKAKE